MKYQQWANDEKWQPEGSGLHILAKQPEGIPPIVRPESTKLMDVSALDDCVKKCRWLAAEQKTWWADFLAHERCFRTKWGAASEDYLSNARKSKWYLKQLKKHKPISELHKQDQDQEERERNLEKEILRIFPKNRELKTTHNTFQDCCVHVCSFYRQPLPRNSCIQYY